MCSSDLRQRRGERGRTKIETMLNNLKTESDSNLNGILQSVKEVSEVMENIKVASQEQAEGVDQINKAIADMDRITQENSALVEQNATSSQHMAQEAEHLQGYTYCTRGVRRCARRFLYAFGGPTFLFNLMRVFAMSGLVATITMSTAAGAAHGGGASKIGRAHV